MMTATTKPKKSDSQASLSSCESETSTVPPKSNRSIYLLYTFFLCVAASVWMATLKKYGYIERDLVEEVITLKVLPQLESSWARLNESINVTAPSTSDDRQRPGVVLAQQGAQVEYPVVLVPGFVTSALEMWQGTECSRNKYFRSRLWGALGSARTMITERDCWREHLALDPHTGGDPENIHLRAAQGFEAADYFMGTYWVWSKILENLADVGYNPSTMTMEAYDWRLSFAMLEERDGYLTKLKHSIEAMYNIHDKKVVLVSHSMGGQLCHYFFAWVTTSVKNGGGGGGPAWVDKHIHAYVNIAGSHLGVPKAASALLSGEMRDTSVFMGRIGSVLEQFFGRRLRKDLWSTWGSLWTMLPQGGDAIWGVGADICLNASKADQRWCKRHEHSKDVPEVAPFLVMTDEQPTDISVSSEATCGEDSSEESCLAELLSEAVMNATIEEAISRPSLSTSETLDFLRNWGGGYGPSISHTQLVAPEADVKHSRKRWHDLTVTPLPQAPNLKIYCFYGTGIDTERGYFYRRNSVEVDPNDANGTGDENTTTENLGNMEPKFVMDTSVDNPQENVVHGVKLTDGDGSIPVLSLGYMCVDGWRRSSSGLNPSKTEVITREYLHRQEFVVDDPMRGGPLSSDHVDILGNVDMMEDLLRIVTGFEPEKVTMRLVSDIENIAKEVNKHGGVHRSKKIFQKRR